MPEPAAQAERTATVEPEDMVRLIAHELRQPLSTIESIAYYLDLVIPQDQTRIRGQLDRLKRMVEQSNWIVSNAVHFVETSPAVPELVSLPELLDTASSDCAYGPSLQFEYCEPPPLIRLDPGQALHLFSSLFVFFRSVASSSHPLRVAGSVDGAVTTVRFNTAAPGYTSAGIQTTFEPFSPGLPAGSGLSMASVRRIVKAHHGSMDVHADPESGVTITLSIPSCSPVAA